MLKVLGVRGDETARLDEAVAAFREALQERTRARMPLDWVQIQTNLGNALLVLGQRGSGTARLEEAITAYRKALKEYTYEGMPLQWAGTQNNLGVALARLGERESGAARLNEAVAAYRGALTVFEPERELESWLMAQVGLNQVPSLRNAGWPYGVCCDRAVDLQDPATGKDRDLASRAR